MRISNENKTTGIPDSELTRASNIQLGRMPRPTERQRLCPREAHRTEGMVLGSRPGHPGHWDLEARVRSSLPLLP